MKTLIAALALGATLLPAAAQAQRGYSNEIENRIEELERAQSDAEAQRRIDDWNTSLDTIYRQNCRLVLDADKCQ